MHKRKEAAAPSKFDLLSLHPAALFFLLSPGIVLQIPAADKPIGFFTGKTSVESAAVHSVVFGVALLGVSELLKRA